MSRYNERMAESLLYRTVRVFLMIVVLKCCGQDGADDGPRVVFPEPNTYDSATKCEWVFDSTWENGDMIYSWYYPLIYTPEIQCLFFFEAGENEVVEVSFNPLFSIEPSTGCKYDYLEIRDGRFGFSPLIGRLCGDRSPGNITSSGRYLWILFVTDDELEYTGFQAQMRFKPAVTARPTTVLKPEECFFRLSGSYDGNFSIKPGIDLVRAEDKHAPVDCVWQIDVPEVNKIKIEFATFEMNTKNHCEQNRILVYDKYSSQEWLIREYCSISAPAAMSISNRMFVRFVASNRSAYNQVEMDYTAYTDRPCDLTFPCGPYMCLNKTLVCNGRPNCWNYAFDEELAMCEAQPKTSLSVNIALAVTMVIILVIMVMTIIVTCRHSCLRTREKAKLIATRHKQLNQQVQTLMDDGNNEANEMNNFGDKYKVSRTGSTANGTRTRSPSGSHDYPMTAAQLKEYEWIMDSELGYEPRQQRTSLMVPDSPWVRANQYNESFRRSSNNPIYPRTPDKDVQVHF